MGAGVDGGRGLSGWGWPHAWKASAVTLSRWCALAAVLGLLAAGTMLILPAGSGCRSSAIEAREPYPTYDKGREEWVDRVLAGRGGLERSACVRRGRYRTTSTLALAGGFELGCLAVWLIAGRRPRLPSA